MSESRAIRVFISSTFLDMAAEREELVKRVFPQLRSRCEARGVTWSEVDLRWGITDEQRAEGKVLPICLAEIERCRPYFIGLLGERYGWVPDTIDAELIETQPWLAEHREHSITELEIRHGVLDDSKMRSRAFFYLRDPSYVGQLSPEQQQDFTEHPTPDELATLGPDEAERRVSERREKLASLKQRIRASKLPVREYADPKALGEAVLHDFETLIDDLFPEDSVPDPLDVLAAEHDAFARSRAAVYVGRSETFETLDAHALGNGPPLVVVGPSGGGKSALVANWTVHWREAHPDDLVLTHFIGAARDSTDWSAMLRRLIGEIDRRLGTDEELPDSADGLRAAFADRLHAVAGAERVVVVLDALNQLEDRDAAPDLVWLPHELPPSVRMVLSTLPGRPLDEVARREWPVLEVPGLEPSERRQLAVEYLRQYTKELTAEQLDALATTPQTANPLFLRVLLEELRLWGDHKTVADTLRHYLEAGTVDELYGRVLARYERDYEADRPGLVVDAMSCLWAAHKGLSEAELLDLLGSESAPLPRAFWSPLYLAAEQSFLDRSGLIAFFHDYLRKAVEDRYLPTDEARRAAHRRLADYFEAAKDRPRAVEELPWQLLSAAAWDCLYDLLTDLEFLTTTWWANENDVRRFWVQIETGSRYRLLDAYRPVLSREDATLEQLYIVDRLFATWGYEQEISELRERRVARLRGTEAFFSLQLALNDLAAVLGRQGRYAEAMTVLEEREAICRQRGDTDALNRTLQNKAAALQGLGRSEEALEQYRECERAFREAGDRDFLQRSLGAQASIHRTAGRLDEAAALSDEQLRVCREFAAPRQLASALSLRASIRRLQDDWDDAMGLEREAETFRRSVGDRPGIAESLFGQAKVLAHWRRRDEALTLLREAARMRRELGHQRALWQVLGEMGTVLLDAQQPGDALPIWSEAERLVREVGTPIGLISALSNHGIALRQTGDLQSALEKHREVETVARTLGRMDLVQTSLGNQGVVLAELGHHVEALRLHQEKERIVRELGLDSLSLVRALSSQASVLEEMGRLDEALGVLEVHTVEAERGGHTGAARDSLERRARLLDAMGRGDEAAQLRGDSTQARPATSPGTSLAEAIEEVHDLERRGTADAAIERLREIETQCRDSRNGLGLQFVLAEQARILYERDDLDGALRLAEEHETTCRELGYRPGLQVALAWKAAALGKRGRLAEALTAFAEGAQICREIGERGGLAVALSNQVVILRERGDLENALMITEEELANCRELGDHVALTECLAGRADLLQRLDRHEEALELHRERERAFREADDPSGVVNAISDEVLTLSNLGRDDEALERSVAQEELSRQTGAREVLELALRNQAVLLERRGTVDEALRRWDESRALCEELGDLDGVRRAQKERGRILLGREENVSALEAFEHAEHVAQELGDDALVAEALAFQAAALNGLGRCDDALAVLERETEIHRGAERPDLVSRTLANQALVRIQAGRPEGATELATEAHRLAESCGTDERFDEAAGSLEFATQVLAYLDQNG